MDTNSIEHDSRTISADRRYASRKFIIAMTFWLMGSLVWIISISSGVVHITADQWITFTKWMAGLYMAGNVGDTAASALGLKRTN